MDPGQGAPIYLDYNATTPLDPVVKETMKAVIDEELWGNPSSSYALGQRAKAKVEEARRQVLRMINDGDPEGAEDEITFTSGGTEANYLALHSAIEAYRLWAAKNQGSLSKAQIPHVVTSNIEHVAIDLPLKHMVERGEIEVTMVEVDKSDGRIRVSEVMAALKSHTCLVTIMMANNETGVIQPVGEVAIEILKAFATKSPDAAFRPLVHTDASQAIGKVPVQVSLSDCPVDYLTICGHKFYGPRIGALYHRRGAPVHPLFLGGGQEFGRRSGTENTLMVVGLGEAAAQVHARILNDPVCQQVLRDKFEDAVKEEFGPLVEVNFPRRGSNMVEDRKYRLPNTTSLSFLLPTKVKGQEVLEGCQGLIQASTTAACHGPGRSGLLQPSPILLKSGVDQDRAAGTVRFSVGRYTTHEDIGRAVHILKALKSQ